MKVNTDKILAAKQKSSSAIFKEYTKLCENNTPVNTIEFMQYVRGCTPSEILENSMYIHAVPCTGTDFIKTVIQSNNLTVSELEKQKGVIEGILKSAKPHDDHLASLTEAVVYLDTFIETKNGIKTVVQETKMDIAMAGIPVPLTESTKSTIDNLDYIIQNIQSDPSTISEYNKLVKTIKTWKKGMFVTNFVPLLIKNTALIAGSITILVGVGVSIVISLPILLVAGAIQTKVEKKYVNAYIRVIDAQMSIIADAIKNTTEAKEKDALTKYFNNLKRAKSQLNDYKASYGSKVKTKAVKKKVVEGISEMCPEVASPDACQILNSFIELFDDDNLDGDENYDETDLDLDEDEDDEFTGLDDDDVTEASKELSCAILDFVASTEATEVEDMNHMLRSANIIDMVTEGRDSLSRKAALTVHDATQGAVHGIRKMNSGAKHTKVVVAKTYQTVDNSINNTIDYVKKLDNNERREKILHGGYRVKLQSIIRKAINSGALYLIHPAIAAIYLLGSFANNKKNDIKVRREVINELENELAIVNEKIEDCRGDSEKEKKYQLIRIKQKLEAELKHVKHGL